MSIKIKINQNPILKENQENIPNILNLVHNKIHPMIKTNVVAYKIGDETPEYYFNIYYLSKGNNFLTDNSLLEIFVEDLQTNLLDLNIETFKTFLNQDFFRKLRYKNLPQTLFEIRATGPNKEYFDIFMDDWTYNPYNDFRLVFRLEKNK